MDFLSIATEEKFANCRLCDHRVGSENPVCSNCGLEMSYEGIIELAEIEKAEKMLTHNEIEFDYIHSLRITATISLIATAVGAFFALGLEMKFFFKIYFWFGLFVFSSSYMTWNKNFAKLKMSSEDSKLVRKEKLVSLSIFLISAILGAFVYIFLLK